ncbi:hypothetical protein RJ639_012872 [Escallonia herrerae]|uniref:Uncharacterized protein n=1 Tax=Escallonia herrerae TaxID=1293975 RepID=A0AA88VNB5_9ASTE|nr:hypothetical protein RJ639_012872 [Escallonia herrerae]
MASAVALKRLVASNLLSRSLQPIRPVAGAASQSASRFFNTNAVRDYDEGDERDLDVDRRSDRALRSRRDFPPNPFSGNLTNTSSDGPQKSEAHCKLWVTLSLGHNISIQSGKRAV